MAKIRLFGVDVDVSEEAHADQTLEKIGVDIDVSNQREMCMDDKKRDKLGRKKRWVKRRCEEEEEEGEPEIPPELRQLIESRQGTTEPVFVCQKRLESCDVDKQQNRLFVKKSLSAIVSDSSTVVSVDARGESYKLKLNLWSTLNVMDISSSEWSRMVKENGAQEGDWVQIWGYWEMEAPRFAINFNKACCC